MDSGFQPVIDHDILRIVERCEVAQQIVVLFGE